MSEPIIDRPDRIFQIWGYTASMRRLVLRSTKSDHADTRIDVLFQNVKAISIPSHLDGILVRIANALDRANYCRSMGIEGGAENMVFEVAGSHGTGFVVADIAVVDEDDGEYYDPSKYWPDASGMLR